MKKKLLTCICIQEIDSSASNQFFQQYKKDVISAPDTKKCKYIQ
jgi:hypothetical protein